MKPSIFSKDYNDRIRKRRKVKRILIVIIVVLIICSGVYYLLNYNGKYQSLNTNNKAGQQSGTKKENSKVKKAVKKSNDKKANDTSKTAAKENSYEIKLADSQSIKINYEETSGNKVLKLAAGGSNITYSINPSGSKAIVCDSAQNLLLINNDGTTEDVTKKDYTATDGTVFTKDNVIKQTSGYVWCSLPKFIDDNTILYLSYLPWFNGQNNKYPWIYNITNKSHTCIQGVTGQNITEGDLDTTKGLQLTVDGNAEYINAAGNVSN